MKKETNELEPEEGNIDNLPENQRTIIDIVLGKNTNNFELQRQINEIVAAGLMVDLPFD
ncbi:MAG: hypothetical protein Q8T08_17580 [Ignavibacteria bacterium]|nr:hypothetical protein [Ignavibacteria bacterium]